MTIPLILFRNDGTCRDEMDAAINYFGVTELITACRDSVVIGRYSVLPFYRLRERELQYIGGQFINSHDQHLWVANLDYYDALKGFTFETWGERQYLLGDYDGPVVIKGKTNSRKHDWNKKMFAPDRKAAVRIMSELRSDDLIGPQGLIVKKYEPLITYEIGLNDLPFTDEYRLFFYRDSLLCHGYYWTEAEDVDHVLDESGVAFAREIAEIAKSHINFFVIDIGRRVDGSWVLIELNDGQMSGLSMCDPHELYGNLAKAFRAEGSSS